VRGQLAHRRHFLFLGQREGYPQKPLGFARCDGSEFLTTSYLRKSPGEEEKQQPVFISNLLSPERSTGSSVGRMSGCSYEELNEGVRVPAMGH